MIIGDCIIAKNWGLSVGRKQTLVGAGAHDGPSLIDHNLLLDICFFGASKAPPPTDGFFKPTDKPKFEAFCNHLTAIKTKGDSKHGP